jgi:NAD(P)-dependent dehydrogenase (short-subunit alcohol dehydrogenase family)
VSDATNIDLPDKTAVVTGSTAGIGFAKGLAEAGAQSWSTAATRPASITRRNRRCPGPRSRALPPISARRRAARRCCRRAIHRYLVNAGIFGPQNFFETPDSEWTRFFEINVMSGVRRSRAYLPGMIERNWGRVVFLSSESVKPLASPSPRVIAPMPIPRRRAPRLHQPRRRPRCEAP